LIYEPIDSVKQQILCRQMFLMSLFRRGR